ncbi:MAG: hypothetical protein AAGL98_00410 [Planctomycetota bacterium]
MKNTPRPTDLDAALRQGARARRALLDQQSFPIGDYPPRPHPRPRNPSKTAGDPAPPRGWGLHSLRRGAWMLGLSGGITAVLLLGLAGVLQFMAPPGSGPSVAHEPAPDTLADSVDAWVARIERAERDLGSSFGLAFTWPGRVSAFRDTLEQPTTLPAPIEQEITAIRHDLLAAADYVRQQWTTLGSGANPAPKAPPSSENRGLSDFGIVSG